MRLNDDLKIQRMLILEELREHTSDCDWARSQHFNEADYYRCKAKKLKTWQSILFVATMIFYVAWLYLYNEKVLNDLPVWIQEILKLIGLLLSCCSIILEFYSYINDYFGLIERHERAGHMYAQLYRQCQFFCTDNQYNGMNIWVEKLSSISKELSRLGVLSPDLSERSYKKVHEQMSNKQYPVDKLLGKNEVRDAVYENIVSDITTIFKEKDCGLEIYWYGSSMESKSTTDIDLAICWYANPTREELLKIDEKLLLIENKYLDIGLSLDLTLLLEKDISSNRFSAFLNNVKRGISLYKINCANPLSSRNEYPLEGYEKVVEYYKREVDFAYSQNKGKYLILSLFYMYYHMLCIELNKHGVSWNSERDVIDRAYELALTTKDVRLESIATHARYAQKAKNYIFLENSMDEDIRVEYLKDLYDNDKNKI